MNSPLSEKEFMELSKTLDRARIKREVEINSKFLKFDKRKKGEDLLFSMGFNSRTGKLKFFKCEDSNGEYMQRYGRKWYVSNVEGIRFKNPYTQEIIDIPLDISLEDFKEKVSSL